MTGLSRRAFLAAAATVPALAVLTESRAPARAAPLLLYDESLPAGRRFSARAMAIGASPVALSGDRVRQLRELLACDPAMICGVSRYADQLLIGEVSREAGYRQIALIQHDRTGQLLVQDTGAKAMIGRLAKLSGAAWPRSFANLALGHFDEDRPFLAGSPASITGLSWVLAPVSAMTSASGKQQWTGFRRGQGTSTWK